MRQHDISDGITLTRYSPYSATQQQQEEAFHPSVFLDHVLVFDIGWSFLTILVSAQALVVFAYHRHRKHTKNIWKY